MNKMFAVLAVVAAVFGIATLIFWGRATTAEDKLKVMEAEMATGRCGTQQFVVIDEKRVAVAGQVFRPEDASQLRFEGGQENLRVRSEDGRLIMDRQPVRIK